MKKTKEIALCGILAALAVVIMCLGGMLPFMTYVCPVICLCITDLVLKLCGKKAAWTWFAAVGILSCLLSPDKEGAAIFSVFGYYPMFKNILDKFKMKLLLKLLYFNAVIIALYWFLMNILGVGQIVEDFSSLGTMMTIVTLALGNLVFFLIDIVIDRFRKRFK